MKDLSVKVLNDKFRKNLLTENDVLELKGDPRKGVQVIIQRYEKREQALAEQKALYERMSRFENQLYDQGLTLIAGIDEAGRGPLAGPVTAAAVILRKDAQLYGLNDSKKLSKENRIALRQKIKENSVAYCVQFMSSEVIDTINILEATKRVMQSSIFELDRQPEHLLIDAVELPNQSIKQTNLIDGDEKSISIAAASILAKEARDDYMDELHKKYPQYGFHKNRGYGTKEHMEALKKYGPCPEHRATFSPVARYLK